ncbi:gastric intrinsic factor-like [Lingula anatina]|uniref:Gastric intrinsic factor-like n=1 Tax=Lingula anatina TaxID=7574 RepID=A0A1S3ICW2_LINAN|nr:gastric intrinsic factor-like [Lingula anatina]|eukprot:XP_013396072.1 gastric intrinsic factor-like [Lingula anatina]
MRGFYALLCTLGFTIFCPSDIDKAREKGIRWLLKDRNEDWGWGMRSEGEAIMALQLADGDGWYNSKRPSTVASVKEMNLVLLAAISNYPGLDTAAWYGGKLGQFINGLVSTCQDPANFYDHNLIELLMNQMNNFPKYYFNQNFAYSWAVLALCNSGAINETYYERLVDGAGNYTFGVDEAAISVIALSCVRNRTGAADVIPAINTGIQYILTNIKPDGSFGNQYTTGLAVQALYADNKSSRKQIKKKAQLTLVAHQQPDGSFGGVTAANQVLPALAGKSYADLGDIKICQKTTPPVTTTQAPPTTTTTPTQLTFTIQVVANIEGHSENQSYYVTVPIGSSLYDSMEILQKRVSDFSFKAKDTSLGHYITEINGISEDPDKRTYWQILKAPDTPLQVGVDGYIPKPRDVIIFRLSTY